MAYREEWIPSGLDSSSFPDALRDAPSALRTAVALTLESPLPACLVWGSSRQQIRNEHFDGLCRDHTAAGEPAPDADWTQKWPRASEALERALGGRGSEVALESWRYADPAPHRRLLRFSITPLRDEESTVRGALLFVHESASTAELDTARRDLDALEYVLSHDLQSPIRTLSELVRLLRELEPAASPDAETLRRYLAEGTAKLSRRLERLVQFAHISRQPLVYGMVDMAALVRGIEGRLVKAYPTHANALVMRELPAVAGDRTLLGRVLEALLDNAFKFSRATARPRIEIDARHEADRIVYVVSDNGVGFDMKFATRLFGLFQRMHSETEFEGTGVDLAIARRIVERHGGTLQGSAAREQGAMFSFSLPRLSLQR